MKVQFSLFALALLATGCGSTMSINDEDANADKADDKPLEMTYDYVKEPEAIMLDGYISSAFEVTVDGKRFQDSEDFYTQKIAMLQQEAEAGGYKGWDMTFDAQIGLDDLKTGMKVYVAAQGSRGYAGESTVEQDGRFTISIPANAVAGTYAVRAVKRVNVVLTSPEDDKVIRWCFNFSGEQSGVKLDGRSLILRSFTSRVTKYKCSIQPESGIEIPAMKVKVEEPTKELPKKVVSVKVEVKSTEAPKGEPAPASTDNSAQGTSAPAVILDPA